MKAEDGRLKGFRPKGFRPRIQAEGMQGFRLKAEALGILNSDLRP